jgi:hypothetical protein
VIRLSKLARRDPGNPGESEAGRARRGGGGQRKYGVRLTEVVSPMERIERLR